MKSIQEENKRMKRYIDQRRQSVRMSTVYDNVSMTKEQLALIEERDQAIDDLQFALDEKDAQLDEVSVCVFCRNLLSRLRTPALSY